MNCYRCSNPIQTSAYTHWNANGIPSVYKKEVVSCIDKDTCSSVTTGQCSAFPSIRANCPLKCDVEQCRRKKCEDTPECDIEPSLCGMLSNDDKYKCNRTCGLCEDVNIQAFRLVHGNVYNWIPETEKVFRFESKIPNDSPDGIGFKTQVRVQAFADHTLRMKFEDSQLYHTINDTLDFPVGPVVSKLLLGYLDETVLVQLKRGHVKGFFVGREEPNAVTNIKRSFISQIALDIPESSNAVLKTPHTGMMIELLRSGSIAARLPLPSKTRKETSLLPIRDHVTSSVTEGPVDLIRLCDSDKDCSEGTRCLSDCNRWACVVQCIPCTGNFCDVTEKWWGKAVDSCKCPDLSGPENPDCQLVFDEVEKTIMCRKNTSHTCRVAIEAWATAYKNAPNANDICCKYGDPNYIGSQIAWNSCSSGITDSNDQAMPTNKFRGRLTKRIGEAATWT